MVGRAVVDLPIDVSPEHTACRAACADGDPANIPVVPKRERHAEFEDILSTRTLCFPGLCLIPVVGAVGNERGTAARCAGAARASFVVVEFEGEHSATTLARRLNDGTGRVALGCEVLANVDPDAIF